LNNSISVETEIRAFISPEEYSHLSGYFADEGLFIKEDNQTTYYLNSSQDLRVQQNDFFSKIWLKKGNMHQESREEIEVIFLREDFLKIESMFKNMGYEILIKWFRKRKEYKWNEINVFLDYTKGYGHVIELEIVSPPGKEEENLTLLREKFKFLGISENSEEEFNKKYNHYKANWKKLVKEAK
jgi:predicted adenylyl cyclase CyaB